MILSPLLANIALSLIEERYQRHVREADAEKSHVIAEQEKAALAAVLSETLGLSLSSQKTLITPVTSTMRFLGHHLRVRRHPTSGRLLPHLLIPKERSQHLRRKVKALFDVSTKNDRLGDRLRLLNPRLRGWASFYRHAWGAKRVFAFNDNHVWWTILRWLHKKHPGTPMRDLAKQYGWHRPRRRALRWRDDGVVPTLQSAVRVGPYYAGCDPGPAYA